MNARDSGRQEPLESARLLDGSEDPDPRVRYRVLAATCALAVIVYVHRLGFATAAPELKASTGLTDRDVSILMSVFLLACGLFEIPFGWLGDRVGVRHVLVVLVVGASILTAGIAGVFLLPAYTVWPFAFLVLLRLLFGAFQAGIFPSTSRMFADWMPLDERGFAQGCLWTSSRIGGAMAPLIVIALFRSFGVGAAAFATLAAVGLLWCGLFWPWFRNSPEDMPGVNDAELKRIASSRPPGSSKAHGEAPWAVMLGSRSVWCLCPAYGTTGFSGNFFLTMLPTYLRTHRQLDAETAGWISAIPLACGALACFIGGFLSDSLIRLTGSRRWGRRIVPMLGFAIAAVAVISTLGVKDPTALAVLLGMAFFGNDLTMGPAWAACGDIGEKFAGTLGGAMNMFGQLSGALGALAVGNCLVNGEIGLLFLSLSIGYLLGSILWLGIDVTRSFSTEA